MSRGKEYKGQTLVIDGSKSGASVVITRLSYDSAFNLQFIGEARYGSKESDQYWYLEKLSYDAAFNLESIETAQNVRQLGTTSDTLTFDVDDNTKFTASEDLFLSDLNVDDTLNNLRITAINGREFTLSGTLQPDPMTPTIDASTVTVTLENYVTKDFNKRAWTIRNLYIYE